MAETGEGESRMRIQGALIAALLLILCPLLCGAAPIPEPEADQLVLVAVSDEGTARISLHERDADGAWTTVFSAPARIGYGGLGKMREGDGRTPCGVFGFNAAFGTRPDPGCAIPYICVGEEHYWSCDQRDGYHYNELVSILDLPGLDTTCSEHLCEIDPEYRYALSIDYNAAGEKGKGSAIFLHCQGEREETRGCVAIPEEQMLTLLRRVRPDCRIVIGERSALEETFTIPLQNF